MAEKKVTSIRIPAELLKKAQNLGLNVSKVCENALRQAVTKLEAPNTQTNGGTPFLSEGSFDKESSWCGRRDLNPGRRRGRPRS